ncbi:hypothetical protein FHT86_001152 [Rhizobium sp. BK313]|jgi:hypothetical protein|uniref:hypothetical protein n=1 Tax=Rhizobium sp. BK313 TaxID=2587081 RepID=UPI00106095E1|nr:hypothetical protein [Rhizobium sp. BK313]MBB3452896.1 hypothetical protein [Rhizobium sp. BK313]
MVEAPRRKRGLGKALVAALVAIILVIGGRWYAYVAYADNPFDEVGIGLNTMMPDSIREKGCSMLKARFENKTLPPAGCGVNGNW